MTHVQIDHGSDRHGSKPRIKSRTNSPTVKSNSLIESSEDDRDLDGFRFHGQDEGEEELAMSYSSGSSGGLSPTQSHFSVVSFHSDVVMATDEIFDGALAGSVPSSVASYLGRRRGSDASFNFGGSISSDDEEDDENIHIPPSDHDFIGDPDDIENVFPSVEEVPAHDRFIEASNMEAGGLYQRRPSTTHSFHSTLDQNEARPSIRRRKRSLSTTSSQQGRLGYPLGRLSQKLYLPTEDQTIIITGYKTSPFGRISYLVRSILTLGLGFLFYRWLPKHRVGLVGQKIALTEADWVTVESQFGGISIVNVRKQFYNLSLSSVFGSSHLRKINPTGAYDGRDESIIDVLKMIDYRYIRLCFHPVKDRFVVINSWKDPSWISVDSVKQGLSIKDQQIRERVFGPNLIDIEEKSNTQLLADEVLHPFYIFQIASLILWSLDEYYYYATCILIISLGSITATLVETRTTMKKMREVARFECDIPVLKNGFWRSSRSSELVPGDIFDITGPGICQIPCDCLLLSGDCIINESMLTGESLPVSKAPATDLTFEHLNLEAPAFSVEVASHVLFAGTKIVRARKPLSSDSPDIEPEPNAKASDRAAMALVLRTGFNTTKGALVRSMLFPKPAGFKFYRDSFRYISVMAIIAAIGFVVSFVNFIKIGLPWHLIVVRTLDLITIVVPPALPATLSIGTSFAIMRLKKKNIFCISPQRVNVGGKLDIVCFDKTGTLTEDGLNVLGVQYVTSDKKLGPLVHSSFHLSPPPESEIDDGENVDVRKDVLFAMATCHTLKVVDDELVGDPLDKMMFDFTGWEFSENVEGSTSPAEALEPQDFGSMSSSYALGLSQETPVARQPFSGGISLAVIKSYEFASHLRRASVIVRHPSSIISVYVKGAPESMAGICSPESFPEDYDQQLDHYTHSGYRVIALATKSMRRVNWMQLNKITREEAESDLEFLGFIIFENKLKPESEPAIRELKEANIRTVMCTGDNILTAISVGREAGIISPTTMVFAPRFYKGDATNPLSRISWKSVDGSDWALDEETLVPIHPSFHPGQVPESDYVLAVTGDTFRWIIDYANETMVDNMLVTGQIFARMSPDEKNELVDSLRSRDYTCGFCGDGANDCGALKAADVGISLSEAEASVAAPFTSRVFDISCVPQVIKEGRAALVTSFSCFKYMSLYSAIQFTSVSFLYASGANLGDFQYLFIDLFLILPIAIFMGWSKPYPILSTKRPTASLVSYKVLVPLLGQIVIYATAQTIAFLAVRRESWFIPSIPLGGDESNSHNSENSALFLVSCFQYILSAAVLGVGAPFRQPMVTNIPFMGSMIVTLAISIYLLFGPAKPIYDLMELTYLSFNFKWFLIVLGISCFGVSYGCEKYVFPRLASLLKHRLPQILTLWRTGLGRSTLTATSAGYDPIPSSDDGFKTHDTQRQRKRYKMIRSRLGLKLS